MVSYCFENESIKKAIGNSTCQNALPLTAPEIHVTNFKAFIVGATLGDSIQPRITIITEAEVSAGGELTTLNFETTLTQRKFDL